MLAAVPTKLGIAPEIELVYRSTVPPSNRPTVTKSAAAYQLLLDNWNTDRMEMQEEFKVLLLNKTSRVLGIYHHSAGGVDSTIADARLIFAAALKACASRIILAHNHPSSWLRPSDQDIKMTCRIKEIGELLDIKLRDHIILSPYGYYSFADEGML